MHITVAICTWNRAELLDQTLLQMHRLHIPAGHTWELFIVNNCCTDHTNTIVESHQHHLPIQRIDEPVAGHCHARNAAVRAATGEYLIWTDDDVLVPEDWVTQYCRAFENFPNADLFGGPVQPWYSITPPKWIVENIHRIGHCWALVDHGSELRQLGPGEYCHGANMAFRTATLRLYPFDPAFGRVGTQLTSGDDSDVVGRMLVDGRVGVWVGTAPVRHYLPKDRLNPDYPYEIMRCLKLTGPADDDGSGPRWFGAPRWAWIKYFQSILKSWLLSVRKSPAWVDALLSRAKARGVIDRARLARRQQSGA